MKKLELTTYEAELVDCALRCLQEYMKRDDAIGELKEDAQIVHLLREALKA